jgi:hypothetical protein
MSAIKIRRYHASESDFSRGSRTRTEILVPASAGVTDLTSSKLVLDMHMTCTDNVGDVLLPVTFGNQQSVGGAQALIRNSAVISQASGILNERRNQNVISANTDWYLKTRAQEDGASLLGNSNTTNYGIDRSSALPDNPFLLWKKPSVVGTAVTESAITRRAEVPVAWKHVDNFGSMPQFPNMAVGDLTYRVEFEDQINVAFPAKMPFSQGEPCDNRAAVASRLGNAGAPLTLTKTTGNYFRPPKQGDICVASFLQATSGNYKTTATSGRDEIESVAIVGGKYVVTLKNGFDMAASPVGTATESCTGITLFYFCPTDMLGPVAMPVAVSTTITASAGVYGSDAAPLVFAKNTPGGIQTTICGDAITLDALNSIPWYVGAPVQFCGIDISGAIETASRVESTITSVKVNGDNVEVVVSPTLAAVGGGATTLVVPTLQYRDSKAGTKFNVNWVVDEVYAELFQLQLTPQQLTKAKSNMSNMQIPWIDQQLIQRNMPSNSTAHTEVLQALAGTVGLAVLTPQNLTLLSGFDNCARYRFAINGKEVTNQDIVVGAADLKGRQLHNYFLKTFFGNLGQSLKKYDANACDYVHLDNQATHAMYPLIIPNMPQESVVQVQLVASDGTSMAGKNLFYIFYRQRVMSISNGRVMISA